MGRRTWIKIYSEKWLRGSIRQETAELRGIFIDLLSLAGDSAYGDNGMIKLAENVGFTDEVVCGVLNISVPQWKKAKNALANRENSHENRIKFTPIGQGYVINIINWSKYQGEYQRQKQYRKQKSATKVTSKVTNLVTGEKEKEKEKEKERINKQIQEIFDLWRQVCKHLQAHLTDTRKQKIKARLKEFSVQQLKDAVLTCSQSEYHMKNDYSWLETNIFKNQDKVEWWLERKGKSYEEKPEPTAPYHEDE